MDVSSCSTVYSHTLAAKPTHMNTNERIMNIFFSLSMSVILLRCSATAPLLGKAARHAVIY